MKGRSRDSVCVLESRAGSRDDKALEEGLLSPQGSGQGCQSEASFLAPLSVGGFAAPPADPRDLQAHISSIELQSSRHSSQAGSQDVGSTQLGEGPLDAAALDDSRSRPARACVAVSLHRRMRRMQRDTRKVEVRSCSVAPHCACVRLMDFR